MVSAFKKSGVFGGYDVVDDFDVILYANSVPYKHELVEDTEEFKTYQAQYFTPSALVEGLTRSRENIANIEGIVFDLDEVPDFLELRNLFYHMLIASKVEAYLWKTASGVFGGKHSNAVRLYIPLAEPIEPRLLPQAVDELALVLKNVGIDVESFGVDIVASKTIGRLMGLLSNKREQSFHGILRAVLDTRLRRCMWKTSLNHSSCQLMNATLSLLKMVTLTWLDLSSTTLANTASLGLKVNVTTI